jgi:hypothetical protein
MKLFSGKTYDAAAGRESRSAFIAQAAFWFAALRFVTHDMSFKIGAWQIHFGKMDAALLGAFLLPCLSLYFGRRLFPGPNEPKPIKDPMPFNPGETKPEPVG